MNTHKWHLCQKMIDSLEKEKLFSTVQFRNIVSVFLSITIKKKLWPLNCLQTKSGIFTISFDSIWWCCVSWAIPFQTLFLFEVCNLKLSLNSNSRLNSSYFNSCVTNNYWRQSLFFHKWLNGLNEDFYIPKEFCVYLNFPLN